MRASTPAAGRQDPGIRVLVADDQDIVRAGLTMILDAQTGIEVVGEAADGREAVALARELRPDVCLLDVRMPRMDGIEATRQLAGPDVADPLAVIVITTFDPDEYVHGALKAGARGFLLDDAGPDLLTQAIQRRCAHRTEHHRTAPRTFADTHARQPPAQPIEPLTGREEEVLIPVAQGWTKPDATPSSPFPVVLLRPQGREDGVPVDQPKGRDGGRSLGRVRSNPQADVPATGRRHRDPLR